MSTPEPAGDSPAARPRPLIIDCDPGVDDAIALMVALNSSALDVLGITTVAGNVPLRLTEYNARRLRTLLGRPGVPVYAGCPRPMVQTLVTAEEIHGTTGLDGAELPEPDGEAAPQHAVSFLIEALSAAPEPVTLACTAPLTNLAVALIQRPEIAAGIRAVVIMGGGVNRGNITPVAEFNFYADPHAARVVFESGLPITLVPLDVTHQVLVTEKIIARIRAIGSAVSSAAADLLTYYGSMRHPALAGAPLHDPCVIAWLLRPGLFGGFPAEVRIETESVLTVGQSVVNRRRLPEGRQPVTVLDTVDSVGVFELILAHLAGAGN
ncbi:MAG: nucleoside hydrolase [Spirochaetaceae bacterium]|nr:MAG: nucleoside hydrolase [Spirochaetaceae bacterium]